MKNLLILSVTLCICCIRVSSAQYAISPRIGEVIDRNEQEYFGLFPSINGFVSATASLEADRQVRIVITRSVNGVIGDTAFTVSPTVANYLVTYIESYETVRGRTNRVSWDFLEGLAASGPVIEHQLGEGLQTTIKTVSGDLLYGKLLYADDSSLILWQSQEKYNWRTLELFGRKVNPTDVEHITLEYDGHIGGGLGYGALIGAGLLASAAAIVGGSDCGHCGAPTTPVLVTLATLVGGASGAIIGSSVGAIQDIDADREVGGSMEKYRHILPYLKDKAIFRSAPPLELEHFENAKVRTFKDTVLELVNSKLSREEISDNAFYIEFGGNSDGISCNYEWRLVNNFYARIGAGLSNGTEDNTVRVALAMPILAYYLYDLGSGHNIQLGGGVLLRTGEPLVSTTVSVGYRYKPQQSGFMFELAFTPNLTYKEVVQVGVGFGYAF